MTATAFGQLSVVNQGGSITINDISAATPNPSTNLLSGAIGVVEKVTVTLTGVSHGYPDDIDIILEAPDGTRTMLMSDAGGQFDLVNTTFTLDGAASALPDEGQIADGGTYAPANYDGLDPDTFAGGSGGPTPVLPGGSYSSQVADLSVFANKAASVVNGTWNLFVQDDTVVDAGSIRSWTLNVYLSPVVSVNNASVISLTEDTPTTVPVLVNAVGSSLSSLTLTATSSDTSVIPNSGLTFGGNTGGTNRTLTITPAANANTGSSVNPIVITITAKDAQGNVIPGVNQQTISVLVTPVNDAPVLVLNTPVTSVKAGEVSTNITVYLTDADSPATTAILTAVSSNPSVVPATNVLFRTLDTTGTNRVVQIAAGTVTGTSTITIIGTDAGGASSTVTLNVSVTGNNRIVGANQTSIVVPDNGNVVTSSITIPSAGNLGLVGKALVSLNNIEHANPSDLAVLLVSPSGQHLILMRQVGDSAPVGITGSNDVRLTFDVDASAFLSSGLLVSGSYGPTDLGNQSFPAGVSPGFYTTDLSVLEGSTVAGTWTLYAYDMTQNSSAGQIAGGWSLEIFTAPVITAVGNTSTAEDKPITIPFTVADADGVVTNIVATSSNPAIVPSPGNVGNVSGVTSGSFTFAPLTNANGAVTISIVSTDNDNFTSTNTFTLNVTPVNDAPTQSVIPKQITRAGQSVGPISFTIGDVETPATSLTVTATSDNPKLLPQGSVIVGGTTQTRTITIFPAGAQAGTANITVTVTDDGAGGSGAASSSQTFNLTVNEASNPLFENGTGIQIVDPVSPATIAAANPYPSTINVSGLQGNVAEVQVTLFGITHPQPDDINVLLVGPGTSPSSIILMGNAGGANALNNVTLRFRQSASTALPDASQIISGDYLPTDFAPIAFPALGAPAPTTITLDAFKGSNPNGDWKLYIIDDTVGPRGGVISSWQLSIRTAPVLAAIPDQTTQEDTPFRLTVNAGDNQPGVTLNTTGTVSPTANTPVTIIQSINDSAGDNILTSPRALAGGPQTLSFVLVPDAFGTNSVVLTFTDPDGNIATRTFNVIVAPVNDAPRFSSLAAASTPSATPTTIGFTVYDPERTAVNVVATSSDQTVVTDAGLVVSPTSATDANTNAPTARTLTITPVGIASGSSTINLTATDADGQKSTTSFLLTVTPNVGFVSTDPIVINDNARATPYPAIINVSGVNGTVSGATVSLVGFTHPFPDDVDVLLVSPDGKAVMLMSDAGGGTSVSNLRLTFSDTAGSAIPDESPLSSGIYKPANYLQAGELDEMPSPAPAPPSGGYSTTLSSFAGVNPNGQWKLYVRDDTFPDGGLISGGWILLLNTAPSISQIATQTTTEDTPLTIRFTASDQDTPVTGLSIITTVHGFDTTFNNPGLILTNNITLITNSVNFPDVSYTLTVLPTTNRPSAGTETNSITLTVGDQVSQASTTFLVIVSAVDDPPIILGALAPSPINATNHVVTTEDAPIVVQWKITDVDSTLGTSSNIVIQSSNPSLVPNATANIAISGPDNQASGTTFTVSATITPAANQNGSTTLTFIVSDRTQSSTNQVTLDVTPVNDLPTIAFPTITSSAPSATVGSGGTVAVPVTVNDSETAPSDIVVTATSSSQSIVPNASILVGGRGANRTLTITPIGTVPTATTLTITVTANDTTGGIATSSFPLVITPPPGSVIQNPGTILIPGSGTVGPASPYPSVLNVANLIGTISRITVSIDGLTHTAPDDIDMLLVSPSGAKSILMSDAGGRNPISNVQLIFDQNAAALPDESQITTGTYAPADYEVGDIFPSPAPAGPYVASLAQFIGTNPNGNWSLYIVDDAGNDLGQLVTGWSLRIETGPGVALVTPTPVNMTEDVPTSIQFTINDQVTPAANLNLSFSSSTAGLIQNVTTSLVPGVGNSATVTATIQPVTNGFGTNNLTIVVRRSDGAQSSVVVPMNIGIVDDAPTFSRLTDRTTSADTALTIPIAVTDVDTPLNLIWLTATSSNPTVIPDVNILIGGRTNQLKGVTANSSSIAAYPAGNIDTWTNILTINPAPAAFSSTPVTITLKAQEVGTDSNNNPFFGPSTTVTFNVTVTPVNHAPTLNGAAGNPFPVIIPVEAGKTTTNIVFTVADPDSDNVTITATSSDQTLVHDADIVILANDLTTVLNGVSAAPGAVSGGGNRVVRVTTQPGVTGDATITLRVVDPSQARATAQFVVRLTPTRERIFSNNQPIAIRDNNSADPYPSAISVSGFAGTISKVTVTLSGFWHTFPDDVDMILVSPSGRKSYLMSDAGGGTPIPSASPIRIAFDDTDSTAVPIPDNAALSSRTYSVANYEGTTSDNFSGRTPPGPTVDSSTPASLATFNGDLPNGVWSLYVADDTPSDSGAITNGWSLGITTLPRLIGLADVTSPEDTSVRIPFTVAEETFASQGNFSFTVASSNPALVPSTTTNIVISGSGTNLVVTIIPKANANTNNSGGPATITLTEQSTGVSASFKASFTPVNDAPVVTSIADQTLPAGTFLTIPNFAYSDVETVKKDLIVSVTSSDPSIVPAANVIIAGTDLRIFAGTQSGTSRITISVTDTGDGINGPLSTPVSFNVTVAAGFNAVVANTNSTAINDNSRATPYPSTVDVRGVNGTVQKITVTLTGLTHPFPDDIDILLVGPNGQGVVLMSDAGGGGTPQTALTNAWVIIDDEAAANLPDNSPIIPFGDYKPTNYEVSNGEFLAPAPAGPYSATLSGAFAGINPNGTWSLFIQDDASPDAGSLASWVLNIALNEVGPILTGLGDTNAAENAFVQIPFTVGSSAPDAVTFTTSASNSNLVSAIKVGGAGSSRTLQITLVPNTFGTSQITVQATDSTGVRTRQFLLTVNHVDQPPVFAALPDIQISGPTSILLNVTDIDTPLTQLNFLASTAGVGLINDVQFSVNGSTVSARIIPAPGGSGTDRITISVSDGTTTTNQSFNVTVGPTGPPVLGSIADMTTAAGQSISIPLTVSDPDTAISNLVFFASSSGSALVQDVRFDLTALNTVVMTVIPNAGQFGTETLTVSVSDGTAITRTSFNFTVLPAGPIIGSIADTNTLENVSLTLPIIVSDPNTPVSQLTIFASTSDPNLVRDVTFITVGTNVTATISLVTNASGSATITVTASNGSTTASRTFRLNVTPVCMPPVIAAIGTQTAIGSTATVTIPVTDPNDPITNLTFQASAAGSSILSGVTFNTSPGGVVTATFTLFPNATGTEQVTVQASDGCGSGKQTFALVANSGTNAAPTLSSARSGTNFVLTVTGTVGSSYVIESTTNFRNWSVVDTVTIPAGGSTQVTLPLSGHGVFFRVRAGTGALAATKTVLFVVGNSTLVAGDLAVSNRLVSLGFQVITKAAPTSVSGDANGKTLVVISSTISSADAGSKFTTSNVPVVFWEQAIADDFLTSADTITDHGTTTADQTQLNILPTTHPLAAGLSAGLHTVATSGTTFSWANPQGNVVKIATIPNTTNEVAIYGYEAGATLTSTNKAAGRRVFLFLQDPGLTPIAAEGLLLFDAAINWAVSSDVALPGDAIVTVSGQNDGDTSSGPPPAAESVDHAIDDASQKYLNFLDLNSGFVVTPSVGRTLVNALRLWTANDAPERDPASYKLEGAANGPNGPFSLIAQGSLNLTTNRNAAATTLTGTNFFDVYFTNSTPYTSYRVTFPTLRDAATANSMQIGEVELFGFSQ